MSQGRTLSLLAAAMLAVLGTAGAWADEVAAPPPPQPMQTEVAPAPEPVSLLAADADPLMAKLIEAALAAKPATSVEVDRARQEPEAADQHRVIELPTFAPVNGTPFFFFEDVTGRQPAQPQLSEEQRRAVVEAFRQEIARERASPAGRRELAREEREEEDPPQP